MIDFVLEVNSEDVVAKLVLLCVYYTISALIPAC